MVEPLSLDEAFLDVTGTYALWGNPVKLAKRIQNEIVENLNLTASVGLSYNKFLAKLASDLKKPKGFVVINKNNFKKIIWPLSVSKVWGVGPKTKSKLEVLNIRLIGELASQSPANLEGWFGKQGRALYLLANGIDDRKVEPNQELKSISRELTFPNDLVNLDTILAHLQQLCESLYLRLRKLGLKAEVITVKIRYDDFTTITRSESFKGFLSSEQQIIDAARDIFTRNWSGSKVRLVGVSLSKLLKAKNEQLSLFHNYKEDVLTKTLDQIRDKHGLSSIRRCSSIDKALSQRREVEDDSG